MRTSNLLTVLSAVAVGACASGGGSTAGVARPASTTLQGTGGVNDRMTIAPGGGPNVNALDFAPDRVWRILPAVFDSVGIPVARLDQATKVIGNEGFKVRQRLGRVALSRYIDCGQTQIGQNADSYEVILTLVLQVQAAGAGSRLITTFEASARPLTFSQGYSRCTSTGRLESRVLEAIRAQLQ